MAAIRLNGARVAITGGARGIGLATAKAFAAQGSRIWIGDLDGAAAAAAARLTGGHASTLDVRSKDSFAAFLACVDGPLDVLVNNAGIMPLGRFLDEDDDLTQATFDINTLGMIWGMKLALPDMLERGHGHVVNIASYLGKVPAAGAATYSASKFAVTGITQALRDELHGTGVTLCAVLPSAVHTDLTAGVKLGGLLPTVAPEQIADAVIDSCCHRRAVIPVPGWMRLYEPLAAITPPTLVTAVRRRLTRQRAITQLDSAARATYAAQLTALTRTPSR
jgi:NAD(P)-dependent dehydrogenase (short-subunit alcohol dehydrogenase family)